MSRADSPHWVAAKAEGDRAELAIAGWFRERGFETYQTLGLVVFDLLLQCQVEVKRDRKAAETGNVAIEMRHNGTPSGIMTTAATWWVIVLDSEAIIVKADKLRDFVLTGHFREVLAGDIFVEKDAIAGVFSPVTEEYDVPLSPIRGYSSLSFAHRIAAQWNDIEKPIFAYYAGDFDPSGFDLERDLKDKLTRYCDREFEWERLAVNGDDLEAFDLFPLAPKKTDRRYQTFVDAHGSQCAELDALPATELRQRVRDAIETHIPAGEWQRLQEIEELEHEQWGSFMAKLNTND